jgi:hypothetical protein
VTIGYDHENGFDNYYAPRLQGLGRETTEFVGEARARSKSAADAALKKSVAAFKSRVQAEIVKQRGAVTQAISAGVGIPGLPQGFPFPTSEAGIKKAVSTLVSQELGLPVITDISVDSLLSLAKGLPFPLPFPLPTRLPTSLADGVQLAAQTAAVHFGPQALIALGLGASVPGVGMAISVGIMLTEVLVGLLGDEPTAPDRYRCKAVHKIPSAQSPIFMLAERQIMLIGAKYVASQGYMTFKESDVLQCITDSQVAIRHALFPVAKGSAKAATLPEVEAALAIFDQANKEHGGAWKTVPGIFMETESQTIIAELTARRAHLQKIGSDFNSLFSGPAVEKRIERGRIVALQVEIAKEAAVATAAVVRSQPSPSKKRVRSAQEIQRLSDMLGRAVSHQVTTPGIPPYWHDRNLEQFALAVASYAALENRKIASLKPSPVEAASATCAKLLQKGFGAGVSVAYRAKEKYMTPQQKQQVLLYCVNTQMGKWSKAQATAGIKAVLLGVKGGVMPKTKTANNRCRQLMAEWAQKNPVQAKCLNALDAEWMFKGCVQGQLGQKITFQTPTQIAATACARTAKPKATPALANQCKQLLALWMQQNPAKAKLLNMRDAEAMYQLCVQAYGAKTITPAVMMQRVDQIVVAAAARAN